MGNFQSLQVGTWYKDVTMYANLEKLKKVIQPTTVEEVRAAERLLDVTPDEPGFVYALESELREEFLHTAHALTRKEANQEAMTRMAMG